MNNAWTPIALRASCATARQHQARSQPLLQLFTSFTRQHCSSHSARSGASRRNEPSFEARSLVAQASVQHVRRPFSTATALYAKKKDRQPKPPPSSKPTAAPPKAPPASALRPAQTIATHTEGVPPTEDPPSETEESEEQLTWRDYDPEGGMPLPSGELDQPAIDAIFPTSPEDPPISAAQGNYILSVMHWRRMSGALIDVGLDFPASQQVSTPRALEALEHLRHLHPDVDESANAQVWAHEETHRLQEDIQRRAVRLGLYKSLPSDSETLSEEPEEGSDRDPPSRTSTSALESLRASNRALHAAAREAEVQATAQAEAAALSSVRGPLELGGGVQPAPETGLEVSPTTGGVRIAPLPRSEAWLQPVERKAWVKYFEEQAQIIKGQAVPVLSVTRRLGPGLGVLLMVLAGAWYLGENYTPPPKAARVWGEVAPSVATLGAITGVLVVGFVAGRVPPLWRTFSKFFTIVPAYPYAVSLVGAGLRHDNLLHLVSNVVTLWLFGLLLHEDVGRGNFLAIYLASGALGGFASLTVNVLRANWTSYIFGSSGSVLGVVAAACTVRPNGTMQVLGYEIPISAWVFLALFAGGEVVAAVRGMKTTIDHAGHLGGILAGVAAGVYLRQKSDNGKPTAVQATVGPDVVLEAQAST